MLFNREICVIIDNSDQFLTLNVSRMCEFQQVCILKSALILQMRVLKSAILWDLRNVDDYRFSTDSAAIVTNSEFNWMY